MERMIIDITNWLQGLANFCHSTAEPAVDALELVLLEMYLCNSVYLSYGLYN